MRIIVRQSQANPYIWRLSSQETTFSESDQTFIFPAHSVGPLREEHIHLLSLAGKRGEKLVRELRLISDVTEIYLGRNIITIMFRKNSHVDFVRDVLPDLHYPFKEVFLGEQLKFVIGRKESRLAVT